MEPSMMEFDFLVVRTGIQKADISTSRRSTAWTLSEEGYLLQFFEKELCCPWIGPDKVVTSWSGLYSDKCLREAVFRRPVTRVTLTEDSQTG